MYSAFENKEEETTPVTTTNIADTQPAPLPRSSMDILQSAGVQTPQRPAAEILKGAGVTSAKDVLRSMYLEKPEGILEAEGISAASILEDYRKEQAAFRQQQNITDIATKAEEDLRKKEQEFIKNYKYNPTAQNQSNYIFNTPKFGKVDFEGATVTQRLNDGIFGTVDNPESFTYNITAPGEKTSDFVFLPEEYVLKGKNWGEQKLLNPGFLNREALQYLYNESQPIDITGTSMKVTGATVPDLPNPSDMGRGFLFDRDKWVEFSSKYLDGKYINHYSFSEGYANNGDVLGIGEFNGELVYVKPNFQDARGRTTASYYNRRIDSTGTYNGDVYTVKEGPIKELNSLTKAIASIPFAPEIAAIIAPGPLKPYVYASMKALQVHGQGGDSGDIVKASAVAFATSTVGQELQTYGDSLGESIAASTGVSTTVANTLGNAVVNAGFNGFVAAATGQDVGDAMLTGAISGSLSRNAADITNTVFGGAENVAALSKSLNLTVKQTQAIFTGALVSGSVNSVVKNQSFMDAFTESLIVQGVSQSGANAVGNSLKGTLNPKALAAIQSNTRIMLQASARAAVRGEDMETAIARVAPYLQGRAIGQTVDILANKKD